MMVMVVLVVCRCSNDSRIASPFMTCEKEEEEEEEQGADECPIHQQCVPLAVPSSRCCRTAKMVINVMDTSPNRGA